MVFAALCAIGMFAVYYNLSCNGGSVGFVAFVMRCKQFLYGFFLSMALSSSGGVSFSIS